MNIEVFFLPLQRFLHTMTRSTPFCVATIGSFDGVHLGHRHVVGQVVGLAQKRGLGSLVVTFPNHPMQVLRPDFRPMMLTTEEEKVALLKGAGAEDVAMVTFTRRLARMTAREFMGSVLAERFHVAVLLMGYDNRFGHDGRGFADCVEYGKELGMEVVLCRELEGGYSSTAIRRALQEGNIGEANGMLGYPYRLEGLVVEGFQNGRRLGYPTANLRVDGLKLIPRGGVYLVRTSLGWGMLNIGTRPTLHDGGERSVEVHIFDFGGDLYGQRLRVELLCRLRGEKEFGSLAELQRQLRADEEECRAMMREQGI